MLISAGCTGSNRLHDFFCHDSYILLGYLSVTTPICYLLLLLLLYITPIINKFFEDFTEDKNKINRALDFRNRHPANIFKHKDHKSSNKLENNIPSNKYWKYLFEGI